ncbi:epidermal growth factor-like protein 7 [Tamandua tetradactyla]|uniref:epidermal growth factor-like protein 7 n=1 Tax=Tamandua tetradactyla TaxID=48850 RepID=UPI004053B626
MLQHAALVGVLTLEAGAGPPQRGTVYYVGFRQVYATEARTVLRCCPGWTQPPGAEGCLAPACSSSICFNGGRCVPGRAQPCRCPQGFQGPRCQHVFRCFQSCFLDMWFTGSPWNRDPAAAGPRALNTPVVSTALKAPLGPAGRGSFPGGGWWCGGPGGSPQFGKVPPAHMLFPLPGALGPCWEPP